MKKSKIEKYTKCREIITIVLNFVVYCIKGKAQRINLMNIKNIYIYNSKYQYNIM